MMLIRKCQTPGQKGKRRPYRGDPGRCVGYGKKLKQHGRQSAKGRIACTHTYNIFHFKGSRLADTPACRL